MNILSHFSAVGLVGWLADFYLLATLLMFVAIIARRWIRQPAQRLTVHWIVAIELAVLAAVCAMPFWPRISLRGAVAEKSAVETPIAAEDPISVPAPLPRTAFPRLPREVPEFDAPAAPDADQPVVPPVSPPPRWSWLEMAAASYLASAGLVAVWLIWGAVAATRACRHAENAPDSLREELARIVGDGCRAARLLVSSRVKTAVALGLRRPTILLPAGLLQEGSPQAIRAILTHEWAHIRNGDLWLLALGRCLLVLLFPHPLLWWLRRAIRGDQELLADAAAAGDNRPAYAEELLRLVRKTAYPSPIAATVAVGIWESSSQLSRRIAMLLDESFRVEPRTPRRWRYRALGLLVILGAACSPLTLQPARSAGQTNSPLPPGGGQSVTTGSRLPSGEGQGVREQGTSPAGAFTVTGTFSATTGSSNTLTVSDMAMGGGTAVSTSGSTVLTDAERVRLRELGSGVRDDLQGQDFPLVERALTASNTEDRQWACLAVEKLCYTQSYGESTPGIAGAARLAQIRLNQAYVGRSFPRLLAAADAKNPDLAEFASRAIGAIAEYTKLLTEDQVAQSCDKAVAGLRSDDFDDRRRGVNLLGSLMRRLDLNDAREKQAVDQLLETAEDWQRSDHLQWDEWRRELSALGTAKQRFQAQALHALLYNCTFITDKAQAMRAYQFLTSGLANQTLDLQAVAGIAALASRLPAAQRHNAVQLAIEGVSQRRFWHNVGSGRVILRNYAADALTCLAPCLDKDELQQALKAIDSQRWNREESKVFKVATIALRDRLTHLK